MSGDIFTTPLRGADSAGAAWDAYCETVDEQLKGARCADCDKILIHDDQRHAVCLWPEVLDWVDQNEPVWHSQCSGFEWR